MDAGRRLFEARGARRLLALCIPGNLRSAFRLQVAPPLSGASASGFELPGRSPHESSLLYLGVQGALAPWSDSVAGIDDDRGIRTLALADRIVDGSNPQEPVPLYYPGDDLFTPFERRRGLPIGNLTSQLFANVYLDGLDHFCKEVLRAKGYLRYVDDFALFHDDPDRLEEWRRRIARFLEGRRLRLHPRKTVIVETKQPAEFLGFVLLPGGRRRLPDANVRRFRNRLRGLRDRWRHGTVTRGEVERRVGAWVAHAEHANTRRLRRAIFRDGWFDPSRGPDRPPSARGARRLLEQQPEEPPLRQPQQEHHRKPERQQRVPSCPHARQPEPAASPGHRVRDRASRDGHDERRPGASPARSGGERRRGSCLRMTIEGSGHRAAMRCESVAFAYT